MFDRLVREPYRLATTNEYTSRFATSWFLSPLQLAIWRAIVAFYAFIVIFISLGHEGSRDAGRSFSYFTVLGYWGLAFYYAVSCAHSASFWLFGESWLQKWPRSLQWLHSVFYATVTVFPFVVTAVFWGALSNGAFANEWTTWSNISQHALNSVMAFGEIVIPRTLPHPWLNILPLVILLALYLGLAYLTHSTQNFYVYPFLDPRNGRGLIAGACIGILAAAVVVFVIVHFLTKLREWITETKLGLYGNLSTRNGKLLKSHTHESTSVELSDVRPKNSDV
ncbi:hypothetical protein D6D10_05788 [Aureobasidium pullulans]|uniref:FAR-17a/AIG1-like protein n=1 Tax=Aureobasidium pullulans TaxID=5580 RepID=A0A4S9ES33_AURPU|nr:hypothetical protein D6D10_05788 [Aureobasidium pullulans]